MRRFALLFLPLLAGCATGPSLQSRMAAYIGAPEGKLVQSLGVPDKQISIDGVGYLAYEHSHAQIDPSTASFGFGGFGGPFASPYYGGYYGGFIDAGLPQEIRVFGCETTFAVRDGHVANVTFKGNDCG